jgi:F420H(2)-dependent quinone reductase
MNPQEVTFKAILITLGRKTGKEHAVELKAVFYDNKFYFSRRNSQSDWLKNSLANPQVKIQYNDRVISGIASLITDENLAKKISQLKYSDKRSEESRIVLEITLHEQL